MTREEKREYDKIYRAKNRERMSAYQRAYYNANRERWISRHLNLTEEQKARRKARQKVYRAENYEKYITYNREYSSRPDRKLERQRYARNFNLIRNYGITLEQFEILFRQQGFKCACCKTSISKAKTPWHVDHDHNTKQIRAILCFSCNTTIGHARENIVRLRACADYLERHNARKNSQEVRPR